MTPTLEPIAFSLLGRFRLIGVLCNARSGRGAAAAAAGCCCLVLASACKIPHMPSCVCVWYGRFLFRFRCDVVRSFVRISPSIHPSRAVGGQRSIDDTGSKIRMTPGFGLRPLVGQRDGLLITCTNVLEDGCVVCTCTQYMAMRLNSAYDDEYACRREAADRGAISPSQTRTNRRRGGGGRQGVRLSAWHLAVFSAAHRAVSPKCLWDRHAGWLMSGPKPTQHTSLNRQTRTHTEHACAAAHSVNLGLAGF